MSDIQGKIDELSAQLSAAHEEYKNKTAELSLKIKHSKRAQKLQKLLDRIEDESGIIFLRTKQTGPFWTSNLDELSTKLAAAHEWAKLVGASHTVSDAQAVKRAASWLGIATQESDEMTELQFLSYVRRILAALKRHEEENNGT